MNRLITLALLAGLALPAFAQTTVPLREGLSLSSSVTRPSGKIETTLRITAINARTVTLEFSGKKADGSALHSTRRVRIQDLQDARDIRPNFVDGATEYFAGTTAFGTSATVLGELKRSGSSTLTVDVGCLSMGTGVAGAGLARELDGMLGDMGGFAGISEALNSAAEHGAISDSEHAQGAQTMGAIDQLQMASGTLHAAGTTTVPVIVNGKTAALPGVVAKGRIAKGDEAYDVELVFLDDAANPLLLKSRIDTQSTQLLRIDYPAAK